MEHKINNIRPLTDVQLETFEFTQRQLIGNSFCSEEKSSPSVGLSGM